MNTTKIKTFIFTAMLIATAITISCSSDGGGGGGDNSASRDACIKSWLDTYMITTGSTEARLQDAVNSCNATEAEVLAQIEGSYVGTCKKEDLDFNKTLRIIYAQCREVNNSVTYGTLAYGEQTYRTVTIGTQVWMAENLNYNVAGSKCYNDDPAYCAVFGRMYDWSMAMGVSSQYNTQMLGVSDVKHQGICPEGWYLPSKADWATLANFAGGAESAAAKLKATGSGSIWWSCGTTFDAKNACDDTYGFAALPGGCFACGLDKEFINGDGYSGYWWSATETGDLSYPRIAFQEEMGYAYANTGNYTDRSVNLNDYNGKDQMVSVRCVKDYDGGNGSSSSVGGESSSSSSGGGSGSSSSNVTINVSADCSDYDPDAPSNKGKFTDLRNSKEYNTIKICDQTWLAENLNFDAPGSVCYDDDPDNCDTYGRLYDWTTAMGLDEIYNNNTYGTVNYCLESNFCINDPAALHQGVCPSGWHVPSASEMYGLMMGLELRPSTAGAKLKATDGWDWNTDDDISGNGTDDYGFAALPGGEGNSNARFQNIGKTGFWWTASESPRNSGYVLYTRYNRDDLGLSDMASNNKIAKFSIRCVKNP